MWGGYTLFDARGRRIAWFGGDTETNSQWVPASEAECNAQAAAMLPDLVSFLRAVDYHLSSTPDPTQQQGLLDRARGLLRRVEGIK